MRLTDEVRGQIQAFIDGRLNPHELEGWLDSVAEEVHSDPHPNLRQLVGRVYLVLAEASDGLMSLDDARADLSSQLTSSSPEIVSSDVAAVTSPINRSA